MTKQRTARGTFTFGTAATIIAVIFASASACGDMRGGEVARGNRPGEWRYWGADAWSTRYSSLDQINASNFGQLQVAWRWNASQHGIDEYYRTTPLFANGRLFTVATTKRQVYAINPDSGQTLWHYVLEEGIRWRKAPRQFAGRGLSYWTDGAQERVIVVTPGYHMVSLDATTGKPDPAFGKDGVVDLQDGLGFEMVPLAIDDSLSFEVSDTRPARRARPGETWDSVRKIGADGTIGLDPKNGQIAASCPPIVVGDVVIVGNSSIHGYYPTRVRNVPGYIRGFDIKTGKQLWKFNLIPEPGEFGAETWKNGSAPGTEGVGKNDAWATYSADPELGIVYIPVGMPLSDEYGGHRPGDNLYGNSIVALDVKTGERKWHFQMVHHDIWDYDTPMAPNLMDLTIDGQPRKIVAQLTKQGWVYAFDRVTGEPIWPMPETPVLQSEVPHEETSPTQPIPTRPEPYAQQGLEEEDLIDYTPAIKDSVLKLAQRCRMGPYYIPPSPWDGKGKNGPTADCSWYAPGASGGVNIDGGGAVDPENGMLYVGGITGLSTTEVGKDPCSELHYTQAGPTGPRDSCGKIGAPDPPPGYRPPARGGAGRGGAAPAGRGGRGGGRGGGRSGRGAADAGRGGARGGDGGGGRASAPTTWPDGTPVCTGGGRGGGTAIAGVSIVKPKEFGGITGYDMRTGDKKFWMPNGGVMCRPRPTDSALFAGVTLPLQASGSGQAQVMNTRSLVIYGTGRSGGPSSAPFFLHALDKSTGREVAKVEIPSKTSAPPMTFLYNGKQYIVFATGAGTSTALVALKLP